MPSSLFKTIEEDPKDQCSGVIRRKNKQGVRWPPRALVSRGAVGSLSPSGIYGAHLFLGDEGYKI